MSDKSEEFVEAAELTLEQTVEILSKPQNAVIAAAAACLVVAAIVRPHETFEFLGFLGLELTVLVYILKFDSPEAALDSFTGVMFLSHERQSLMYRLGHP